jgi:hypothetical protein
MRRPVEKKVCGSLLSLTLYFKFSLCYTENVEEKRAVRAGRGQGGHAYQLEKALKPIMGEHVRTTNKANEGIPENVPENPMAPQSKKNQVISVFYPY